MRHTAIGEWRTACTGSWTSPSGMTKHEHGKNMCKEPAGHEKSGAVYSSPSQGQLQDQYEEDTV